MRYHICFNIQTRVGSELVSQPTLDTSQQVCLFTVAIDLISAIVFWEFSFSFEKQEGFEMKHIILLKILYLRGYFIKRFYTLTPFFFIKAIVLLRNGPREVTVGAETQKDKTNLGTITNTGTHSIFWNFVRYSFPLFCRWLKSQLKPKKMLWLEIKSLKDHQLLIGLDSDKVILWVRDELRSTEQISNPANSFCSS